MIELGADIEAATRNGTRPLHLAAKQADQLPILTHLLELGANVHARDADGNTALSYAVECGSLKACQELAKFEARIDVIDTDRKTLLHAAVQSSSLKIVQWLVEVQPSLMDAREAYGCTPVHYAMSSHNLEIHDWALNQSPDFNLDCLSECGSHLHNACRNGHGIAVSKIIQRLSREELLTLCRKTSQIIAPPLTLAVIGGHLAVVEDLLQAGVDMDIAHPPWEPPLTEAIRYGRLEIARELLAHRFDTEQKSLESEYVLDEKDDASPTSVTSEEDSLNGEGHSAARHAWVDEKLKELLDKAADKAV
jgi:ankyrin repeat protein